eukprot:501717_1
MQINSIPILLKKRWRNRNDLLLDIVTYFMVISLLISSFMTLLDWFFKTAAGSFLFSKIAYDTFSIYFIIMFIICDFVFVFLFDDTDINISNNDDIDDPDSRASMDRRSKISTIQSIKYSVFNPKETIKSITKEELTLIFLIILSYIMRCTQYNTNTSIYTIIHDIGYGIVRFLTFLHINDYYGIRPYLLSISFLLFLLRDIIGFLYVITIN